MRKGLIDREMISSLKYLGTISFSLTLHIIGGFFVGRYLDGRFGTEPILAVLCTVTGTFTAFYGIYRLVMRDASSKADSVSSDRSERDDGERK